jgi:hypothetical protein
MKLNFQAVSKQELRDYVLNHRDDDKIHVTKIILVILVYSVIFLPKRSNITSNRSDNLGTVNKASP